MGFWFTIAIFIIGLIAASIRILREYERGVIFFLGRFWKVKGPGLILVIPVIQQMVRVDLRMPTELEGSVQRGPLDRPCVIRDLSGGGALVALDPPVPPGSRITLRLAAVDSSLSLQARVAWTTEDAEAHTVEAGPAMGVRFEDLDPEAQDALLRFRTGKLQNFRL